MISLMFLLVFLHEFVMSHLLKVFEMQKKKKEKRDSFFLNIKKFDSYSLYPENLMEEFPNNELKPAFYLIF